MCCTCMSVARWKYDRSQGRFDKTARYAYGQNDSFCGHLANWAFRIDWVDISNGSYVHTFELDKKIVTIRRNNCGHTGPRWLRDISARFRGYIYYGFETLTEICLLFVRFYCYKVAHKWRSWLTVNRKVPLHYSPLIHHQMLTSDFQNLFSEWLISRFALLKSSLEVHPILNVR